MWTVIYIAPNLNEAETIQNHLTEEGFLVKIKASKHESQYEISVAESELDEVEEILARIL